MSLQLQLQIQLVTSRNHNVSLSLHGSHHPKPTSSLSNLTFRSSLVQQRFFPLVYKSNGSVSSSKHPIQHLQIVAADKDHIADSPAKELRRIISSPGIHKIPACFDALSAKLVERAGFNCSFAGGFAISAARLAMPDAGLISYGEMVEQGRQITQAVSIPVFGDADTGYGNAMNVKRTVKEYIRAGFAGISLEDQSSPKACGHTQGRKVVSREEAVMRIKAAVDARRESGSDIVIVARSDSRQADSLEESLWRAKAYADAGADVLFITALTSKDEMIEFCKVAPGVPKLASMLEGGGKTPILSPSELEAIGYKFVLYPLSLLGVSIRAIENALKSIENGHVPHESMPTFEELKDIVGFNTYNQEEKLYATTSTNEPVLAKR